jgi:glycerol-3-phosphate acyltransferase PlsY
MAGREAATGSREPTYNDRVLLPVTLVVFSYLIGSIPFSYLVVRLVAGSDIRTMGSRNVGATNVARTSGRLPGIIALLLDLSKGYAAVTLARWMTSQPRWPIAASPSAGPFQSHEFWIALAGLIAVLGHMFPLWLNFHGGKGVATAAGVFLALDPLVLAAAMIVFAIAILVTRTVSLGSILSAASIPLFFHFLAQGAPFWRVVISIPIALAVILKHHSNIARLAKGTERKMGQRKDEKP